MYIWYCRVHSESFITHRLSSGLGICLVTFRCNVLGMENIFLKLQSFNTPETAMLAVVVWLQIGNIRVWISIVVCILTFTWFNSWHCFANKFQCNYLYLETGVFTGRWRMNHIPPPTPLDHVECPCTESPLEC